MPILFSAVACDNTVIANFASCDGNFMEIAEQVLPKLPASNKMTYSHGIYLLHYIAEDNYTYFCITDRLCQRSRSFLFLNEIQRQFAENKVEFTSVLATEMYRYSEDYSTINIRKGELDELNKIGVGCSESILGEKILYINNPDNISYSTISYVHASPETVSLSIVTPDTNPEPGLIAREIPQLLSSLDSILDSSLAVQRIKDAIVPPESITESNVTPEIKSQVIVNSDKIPESLVTPEIISEVIQNAEKNTEPLVTPKLIGEKKNSEKNKGSPVTPKMVSEVKENFDKITETLVKPKLISEIENNSEKITESLVPPDMISDIIVNKEKNTETVVTPRLYIVIIGMMILVIAMAVYALGPISCAVVTSIGIYSLFRSFVSSKDKSSDSDAKEN